MPRLWSPPPTITANEMVNVTMVFMVSLAGRVVWRDGISFYSIVRYITEEFPSLLSYRVLLHKICAVSL